MASLPILAEWFLNRTLLSLKSARYVPSSRQMSSASSAETRSLQAQELDLDLEDTTDNEESGRIEAARNVSNLSANHYRQVHGQPPDLPYKNLAMRKKLFAKFGFDSKEDPRIMWPSREKLMELEQEEIEEGKPLAERLQLLAEEKEAKEKAKLQRRQMIEKKMSEMPKLIADYRKRLEKADDEVKQRRAKRDALLEEARDYFGYNIQANDPKFEQMVQEKAEEERKQAKKIKKEEKLKKAAAKLEQEAQMFAQKSKGES